MTAIDLHATPARRLDTGILAAALTAAVLLIGTLALAVGAPAAPDGPLVWHGNAAVSAQYR